MSDQSGEKPIINQPGWEAGGQMVLPISESSRAQTGSSKRVFGLLTLSDMFPDPRVSAFKEGQTITPGEAAVYEFVAKHHVASAEVVDDTQDTLAKPEEQ